MTVTLQSPARVARPDALDAVQRSVVARPAVGRALLVVGAPGSGKTTTALATFSRRIANERGVGRSGHVLLAPTRRTAGRLRDVASATALAGGGARRGVAVHTPSAYAFSIVRAFAVAQGRAAPSLITGAQQDQVIGELLAGHAAGFGRRVAWPETVPTQALSLPAFRDELRDLFMRAAEFGLTSGELAERGRSAGRPEWVAAAAVLDEYRDVLALADLPAERGERYDPARVISEAATVLEDWEAFVEAPPPHPLSVVVDDFQETTPAAVRLLHVLADRGVHITLFADPDVAVQTFRGGRPQFVGRATAASGLGGFAAEVVELPTVHRGGSALRDVVREATERVPVVGGVGHRRGEVPCHVAAARGDGGGERPVRAVELPSEASQYAFVARLLREASLHEGMSWNAMAVVVRSAAVQRAMAAALRGQLVPVARTGGALVLREEAAVRALLSAVEAGVRGLTPETVEELLLGAVGGYDPLRLRQLLRHVRARVRAGEFGGRGIQEALVELLASEAGVESLPENLRGGPRRLARVLAAVRDEARVSGATHESVLWAAWHATGLERVWQQRAVAGGAVGERADSDLDAVMALFAAASNFAERTALSRPMEFVDRVRSESLPSDTLAAMGQRQLGVQVLTVAEAAGREWELVVVPGLQEGAWPDTRLRDTLLGAGHLAEVELGRIGLSEPRDHVTARNEVVADERRMFVSAISRATRRVVVTAVRDEDMRPSVFFDQVADHLDPSARGDAVERPGSFARLDLRGLVATLRAEADRAAGGSEHPTAEERAVARLLAMLARAGVAGADPRDWAGLEPPTTLAPLKAAGQAVHVSPSRVELAGACPLRWALETSGGRRADRIEQSLGSLVHDIAAAHPHGTTDQLLAALDARFDSLELPEGWIRTRERRRAEGMLRLFADYAAGVPGAVGTEVEVEQRVGDAVVHGRIDRLEHVDGGVRVVDLKTGREVSLAEGATNSQLAVYQLALNERAHRGGDPVGGAVGARLVYLRPERRSAGLRPQDSLPDGGGWARETLEAAVAVMRGGSFQAVVNATCQFCPVRTSCPVSDEGERCSR